MRRFSTLAIWLVPALAVADEPPKPDLKSPVDYVAWVNEEYGGSIKNNAATQYQQAYAAFVGPNESLNEELGKTVGTLYGWQEDGPGTLPQWIRANQHCLRLFTAATRVPQCYFRRSSESGLLIDALYPHMVEVRNVAKVLAVRARLRLADGNVSGALDDVCTILRAARHLRAHPSLLEYLSAYGISRLAYETLWAFPTLATRRLDYDNIFKRLRSEDPKPPAPLSQLRIEKVRFWDTLQRPPERQQDPLLKTRADLEIALAQLEEIYAPYDRFFVEKYTEARKLNDKMQEEFENIRVQIVPGREGEAIRASVRLLASITHLAVWQASVFHRQLQTQRNATRVILAMHAFKAKHNRWPQTLSEATPGNLGQFRADPFSGQDLRYRIDGGKPLLYSVGRDGEDDGGRWPREQGKIKRGWREDGDFIFWPPQHK